MKIFYSFKKFSAFGLFENFSRFSKIVAQRCTLKFVRSFPLDMCRRKSAGELLSFISPSCYSIRKTRTAFTLFSAIPSLRFMKTISEGCLDYAKTLTFVAIYFSSHFTHSRRSGCELLMAHASRVFKGALGCGRLSYRLFDKAERAVELFLAGHCDRINVNYFMASATSS